MTIIAYSVGAPWPYPLAGEGMQALIQPGGAGLQVQLVCSMTGVTRPERQVFKKGKLRIGLLPSPPLVWLVLAGKEMSLDASFAPGLGGSEAALELVASATAARSWTDRQGGLLSVILVDAANRQTEVLRTLSLSRDWWLCLADAMELAVIDKIQLTQTECDAAITRDLARWSQTSEMLKACTIAEVGGKL